MSHLRYRLRDLGDWALSGAAALLILFVVANVLFAVKSLMGIDLFPHEHAGSFFAAGRGIFETLNG